MRTKQLLLSVLTILLPLTVFADVWQDPKTKVNYEYAPGSGVASVTNSRDVSGKITLLSNITVNGENYEVTSIGFDAFRECSGMTSVTIPNSVTSMSVGSFKGCSSLTSVELHCSKIENWFYGNTSIKEVVIGDDVMSIGYSAFSGCSGLTKITIPNSVTSIGSNAFQNCGSLTSITIPNRVTSIGDDTFRNCSNLIDVTLPDCLTHIGGQAFCGCSNLSSINIPVSVTSIEGGAFSGCSSLTEITLPPNMKTLSERIFSDCPKLSSITIPDSVKWIGDDAFKSTGLTSVIIPSSVIAIGNGAFEECSNISSIVIPNSVMDIGERAFYACSVLITINIPDSLKEIRNGTFEKCTKLSSIFIPNSVTSIGKMAFKGCSSLVSVAIPQGVAGIANQAFADCSSLESVIIPNSVTTIDYCAFIHCKNLSTITIPKNVTSIGSGAFQDCNLSSIICKVNVPFNFNNDGFDWTIFDKVLLYVPSGSLEVYKTHLRWKKFKNILQLEPDDEYQIDSESGDSFVSQATEGVEIVFQILNVEDKTCRVGTGMSPAINVETSGLLTIPSEVNGYRVTEVAMSAFAKCNKLDRVIIPNSVELIGTQAFFNCSNLTTVDIPNSVKKIGVSAFEGCKLTSIIIPQSVTSIGEYAFKNCLNMSTVVCEVRKPFDINVNVFYMSSSRGIILYVPKGSIEAYQASEGWNQFKDPKECGIDLNPQVGDFFAGKSKEGSILFFRIINVDSNTCQLAKVPSRTLGSFTIPSEVSGYTVTEIANESFDECKSLSKITIPYSITKIEGKAFWGTTINSCVFTSIEVDPENTTYDSRDNCNAVIETSTNTLIIGCSNTVIPNSVKYIGKEAFYGCKDITSLDIPNSVLYIDKRAFFGCSSIERLSIPNSVISVEECAFEGCEGLKNIVIPNTTKINKGVFAGCYLLESIICENMNPSPFSGFEYAIYDKATLYVPIGSKDVYMSTSGWNQFKKIEEIELNVSSPAINKFTAKTVENIDIEYQVISEELKTCKMVSLLVGYSDYPYTVTIPSETNGYKVIGIGEGAFGGKNGERYNLISVVIPNSVNNIEQEAFCNCISLESVSMSDNVYSIGSLAFYDCSSLSSVTLPNNLKYIGDNAFARCSALSSISIPKTVTNIGSSPFADCSNLNSIKVEPENRYYDSRDNCNAIIYNGTLISGCANTVIPNTITRIDDGAFSGCTNLSSISIPNTVGSLGGFVFSGCINLSSIIIPNSVDFIYRSCFLNCSNLKTVVLPENLERIEEDMFWKCSNLSSINIPENVWAIGGHAFYSCQELTLIRIPSKVTRIGNYAFYGSDKLSIIISEIEKPFDIGEQTFSTKTYNNATLYVPIGTADAYRSTEGWKEFKNIVEIDTPDEEVNPITGIIDWDDTNFDNYSGIRKNPNYWYAKDEYGWRTGFVELHANVYGVEDMKEDQTTELKLPISAAFMYNRIVDLTSDADKDSFIKLTNGAGYTGKDVDLRLEFIIGALKTFKGVYTDGKVYQFFPRISADGLTLSFVRDLNNNGMDDDLDEAQVVAKLVYTDMAKQDINHMCVEYQKTNYAKALLNYLPQQVLNDDVLTVYVAVKGKIGDSEIELSGDPINVRFLRPINVKENVAEVEDASVNDQQVIYLNDIVKLDDWRNEPFKVRNSDNYWFYYGVTDIQIVDVAAGANLATNNVILTNLSLDPEAAPTKQLSEVSELIELQYNPKSWTPVYTMAPEQADFGTLTYTLIDPSVRKFTLQLPVRVRYIWGEVYSTIQVNVINSAYLEDEEDPIGWYTLIGKKMTLDGSPRGEYMLLRPDGYLEWKNKASGDLTVKVHADSEDSFYLLFEDQSGKYQKITSLEDNKVMILAEDGIHRTFTIQSTEDPIISPDGTFTAQTTEGVSMFFRIISEAEKTCQVGNSGQAAIATNTTGVVTIPSVIGGYTVTRIANRAFKGCGKLTQIIIPTTVTEIGNTNFESAMGAFHECAGLTSMEIPTSVTLIGRGTFSGCTKLTELRLPESVTTLGSNAFDGCRGLTSVVLSPFIKSIELETFRWCTSLESIEIPGSVGSISYNAFQGCDKLKAIYSYIEDPFTFDGSAFATYNTTLFVPVGTKEKYQRTSSWNRFSTIEEFNAEADGYTFTTNKGLTYTVIGHTSTVSVKAASKELAGEVMIPEVVMNSGKRYTVVTIKSGGFADCAGLQKLTIAKTVNNIGVGAFVGCSSLTAFEVTSGSNYTTVDGVLYAEHQTRLVAFPAGRGGEFELPKNVTSLADGAFAGCSKLTVLTATQDNPITLTAQSGVFEGMDFETCELHVPLGTASKYRYAEGWKQFQKVVDDSEIDVNGMIYSVNDDGSVSLSGADDMLTMGDYVLPTQVEVNGVTYPITGIAEHAFEGCTGMISLTIPEGITTIGDHAFAGCSGLEEIYCYSPVPIDLERMFARRYLCARRNTQAAIPTQFEGVDFENCVLYVPCGSAEYYRNAIGWCQFKHIVEMHSENDPALKVMADNLTMEYGEAMPAFSYSYEGPRPDGEPVIECEATAVSAAGTYDIVIKKGSVKNYNDTYVNGTLTITKAPLTIKVDSYSRKQGEENPEFVLTYEGFKNGETAEVLTAQPTVTTEAVAASEPGKYAITISGAEAQNYEITYVPGELTVTEADPVTLTAKSYTREYGEENPVFEFTSEGVALDGEPVIECEATAVSAVGSYDIIITKGSVKNYNDTYVNGTLTITKAPLTIKVDSYSRKQGEENPEFVLTYEGFKNGETADVLTVLPTVTTEAVAASEPGKYAITISGAEAQNYEITYVPGELTVTEADPVTLTALSYTREYGEENPAFEFMSEGAALNGEPAVECEATAASAVGTYTIVIKKGGVKNYNDTYVNGTLTITKAPLKVGVKDVEREQGQENPQFELVYEGWKLQDTESVLLTKPVAATTAKKDSPAGEYVITVSGGEAENYALTYENGTLTVTVPSGIEEQMKGGKTFDVYDMSGRKVRRQTTTLNDLPKGVYIIGGRKQVVR